MGRPRLALSPGARRPRDDRGAVFVDTLIALVLAATALAATFQVIGDVAARSGQENARRGAMLVAQSALAAVGAAIPLSSGETAGTAGPYVWTVDVDAYGAEGPADAAGQLMKVVVRVRARAGGAELARLSSLRLASAG
ncbi:MAG TPA: hypothetical protein VGS12_13360 [Caulobacteraceae bacterium]|nr:hypothetical protein [Caulobacteraceae bacterium]